MGLAHTLRILAGLKSKLKFLFKHVSVEPEALPSPFWWSPGQCSLTCRHPVKWSVCWQPSQMDAELCAWHSPDSSYRTMLWEIPDRAGFSNEKCHQAQCSHCAADWREGKPETGWCDLLPGHNPPDTGDPVYGAFPSGFNPVLHRNQSGTQKC